MIRNGATIRLQGQLADAPMDTTSDEVMPSDNRTRLGLRLRALTEQDKATLGGSGVLITAVDPTGLAAQAGLQAGDVITNLHQKEITSIEDFASALEKLPSEGVVTMEVVRQGIPAIIGIRIE